MKLRGLNKEDMLDRELWRSKIWCRSTLASLEKGLKEMIMLMIMLMMVMMMIINDNDNDDDDDDEHDDGDDDNK